MSDLADHMQTAYRQISGSESVLTLDYRSEWGASADPLVGASEQGAVLAAAVDERRRGDVERRVTTVGPHRDDPVLILDGHDVRVHGSQGEQRTTALALRLAVHHAVTARTAVPPVLLLDDVFSELDADRAVRLAASLPAAQTLITSARPADVPVSGKWWKVGAGKVEEGRG